MSITRTENFYIPDLAIIPTYLSSHKSHSRPWSGGGFNKLTVGSVKRKFEELILAISGMTTTCNLTKGSYAPIAFYKEELPGGAPNSITPMLIRARMTNFDVRRFLVDQGSFVDIMYSNFFITLQLDECHFNPFVGSYLQGFNGTVTKPWGFMELIVSFGEAEMARAIKVQFLVVHCSSIYQCIFGWLTLADLLVVPSIVHLKMKYYM